MNLEIDSYIEAEIDRVMIDGGQVSVLDPNFKKQTDFIIDPFRMKALFCTRRAAKTYTGGIALCETSQSFENVNCLYLGLTRLSAKGIVWNDVLKTIDRKHNLGMSFNGSELTATMQNGSIIYVSGIDADEDEMHKLLGKKWKLVIIDEAQSYSVNLRALVYGILGPAMVDQSGTICLMGTAGNLTQGLFYDITNGKEPGWKLFEWTAHDNPYVAKQWQEELDDIEKNRPLFKETSLFKQWYLNQWVIDEEALVYRFREDRDLLHSLPNGITGWHYILGLDLAHSPDSTAFVIGCYHDAHPCLYIVKAYKRVKMDLTDVATTVKAFDAKYNFDVKVVDGANKQAVAELNNRHGLGLIPADKTGKVDFITIMNDDFIQRRVALVGHETKDLAEEYKKLIWVTDANGKVIEPKKENPNIHNDLSDAALYLWRYGYQYLFKRAEELPDMSKQEVWEPIHIKKLEDQVRKAQNPNELDLEWEESFEDMEEFS